MYRLLNQGGIISQTTLPAKTPKFADFPADISDIVVQGLKTGGIEKLYQHQAKAVKTILEGKNIMICTSTASGKSLVYTVPILNTFAQSPLSTALYLTPTKALGQNQLQAMQKNVNTIHWPAAPPQLAVCDGDTPFNERSFLLNNAQLIFSTPDFLHATIMPRHRHWSNFFKHLRYVVVDEAHTYRGIFGNHVCQVFRRLRRLCTYYGANPIFILCSATIANPEDFAQRLTGLPITLITGDSCPTGEKTMVFYQPQSLAHFDAAQMLARFIREKHRVIMFGRSKNIVESTYRRLAMEEPTIASQVTPYKGTYTPEKRRELEEQLFSGKLAGVISTNALELGIDIGDLDVCILCGFPGSIASTWQQSGRVGRSRQKSLVVLVASDDPLDRYMVNHPEFFFAQPSEKAIVNPHRLQFMADHLPIAAQELPLVKEDLNYWEKEAYYNAVQFLRRNGKLQQDPSLPVKGYLPVGQPGKIGLRGDQERYLLKLTSGQIIEQTTYQDVLITAYPGAIVSSLGKDFRVRQVDTKSKTVYLEPLPNNLLGSRTQPVIDVRIYGVKASTSNRIGSGIAYGGELTVLRHTLALKFYNPATLRWDEQPLDHDLPPLELATSGIWLDLPLSALPQRRHQAALHAIEHLLRVVIPWQILCERSDLGSHYEYQDHSGRIYIYDDFQGGVGLAENSLESLPSILERCLDLVAECPCQNGCPSCIHIPQCEQKNFALDKEGAIILLAAFLGQPADQQAPLQSIKTPSTDQPGVQDLRRKARETERQYNLLREQAMTALEQYPEFFVQLKQPTAPTQVKSLVEKEKMLLALIAALHRQQPEISPVNHQLLQLAADLLDIDRQFFLLRLEAMVARGLVYGSKERGYSLASAILNYLGK